MIKKYMKKPVVIKALQWDGMNTSEILAFAKSDAYFVYHDTAWEAQAGPVMAELYIKTLEGDMHANKGDYIIQGVRGEFYPCAKDIFEETYDEVEK
jgi:hypothetical protein